VSAYSNSTVTILAFIFIPTTLASSVFGMNVQEINNTGKDIWIFIVTAMSLTGAALAAWFLSYFARAKWHGRDDEPAVSQGRTNLSRKERFSHARWLFSNSKYWKDMPQGTFLGVVTNGRLGVRGAKHLVESAQIEEQWTAQARTIYPTSSSRGGPPGNHK